jgi:hypothetical protein
MHKKKAFYMIYDLCIGLRLLLNINTELNYFYNFNEVVPTKEKLSRALNLGGSLEIVGRICNLDD